MKANRLPLTLLFLLTVFAINTPAAVRYVNVNSANPAPPYTTWATAARTIQQAVDVAVAGDEILVTNGVYQSGGRVAAGQNSRVAVDKPLTVRSVSGAAATVIQGYQVPGSIFGDTAVRCAYLTNGATLIGFTLTNGATKCCGCCVPERDGAGVWCESTNAIVRDCLLTGNWAAGRGGGAYGGTLNNCTLNGNVAKFAGGGIYSGTLNNCTIKGNFGGYFGGGACGGTLNNCAFSLNTASKGGGVYSGFTGFGNLLESTLNNCTLSDNSATEGGGAYGGTLNNCLLDFNSATSDPSDPFSVAVGGGAYGGTLNNCLLTRNTARVGGGAGVRSFDGVLTLNNCTLSFNTASTGGGVSHGTLNNCIIYYNVAGAGTNHIESALNYCCTTALSGIGEGNITNEPLFIARSCLNFRLQPNSPCVNAGGNASVVGNTDLDGNPRIVGGTVDIGAYEVQGSAFSQDVQYAFTNFAGLPGVPGTNDGTGSGARFSFLQRVALDNAGNVIVADGGAIRKITPAGVVTTLVGGVTGFGVAVDSSGNIYVAGPGCAVRKIAPGGAVSTLAGSPAECGSVDGTSSVARFGSAENPTSLHGVAVDGVGNLYVADTGNSTIRKVTPTGAVTTLAGSAGRVGSADGTGSAARFYQPQGVAVDSAGNVYVADTLNLTIRKITPGGVVTTVAGSAGQFGTTDGLGSAARFLGPVDAAVDRQGNVYVVDNSGPLRKVSPDGVVSTLGGSCEGGSADGIGRAALFNIPVGVAVDSAGNIYVADFFNHRISKGMPLGAILSPTLDRILVSGPSNVSPGSGTQFTCTASYSSGPSRDVGAQAVWQIVGSTPAGTYIQGNTLFAGNTTFGSIMYLSARYSEGGITVTSDPLPVTIKPAGLKVSISQSVDYQNAFLYGQVRLSARVTGATGTVAYLWSLPGASQRGPLGSAETWAVYDQRKTYSVSVTVADDVGTATASAYVSVTSRPVTGQPPVTPPVDPAPGQLRRWSNPFQAVAFDVDWQSRTNRGLIVITHGLNDTVTSGWAMGMAFAIREKLGSSCPNIVLFDWKDDADPVKLSQYKLSLDFLPEYGGLDWSALENAAEKAVSIADLLADLYPIRFVTAPPQGIHLANWISTNIQNGNVKSTAPIQIIGHSAGGFVAGECATTLRNILPSLTNHVTMLDTPVPFRRHIRDFPNPGKVERYISSFIGQLCFDFVTPGPRLFDDDVVVNCLLADTLCANDEKVLTGAACFFSCILAPGVRTSSYYHRSVLYPNIVRSFFVLAEHKRATDRYTTSIISGEADGFYYSPWLAHPLPPPPAPPPTEGPLPPPPGESEQSLGGFSTFGSVTLTNGVYQITEAADAGIFKTVALPVGTEALRFSYHFTAPGDGDFLSVHWGSNVVVYRGPDVQLTRANLLEAEVPIAGFAGRTNTLTFTLVSRGNPQRDAGRARRSRRRQFRRGPGRAGQCAGGGAGNRSAALGHGWRWLERWR